MQKPRTKSRAVRGSQTTQMTRRAWLGAAAGGAALFLVGGVLLRREGGAQGTITVYRDPSCGCCGNWVDRMRQQGFDADVREVADVARIKREHGVPERLYSCHTSIAGDFVFEGHVPPDLVIQVLRDQPAIAGLAVPGMPPSSPGMETGPGTYEVISFSRDGKTAVFAVRS